MILHCRYNLGHCTAVQPKLDRVTLKTFFNQLGEVIVGLEESNPEVHERLSGGLQRRAGEQKTFNSTLVA